MVLSVQPDVLVGAAQTPSFRGRGLLGRFLFLLPRSLVGKRNIETFPIPTELRQRYNDRLRHLLTLPWNTNSRGEQTPYVLTLEHSARAEWLAFAAQVERSLAEGGSMAGMRDWGGKLPGQVLRLAGLCHATLSESPHNQQIQAGTMRAVITFAELLSEHARAAFCLLGADDTIECAKAILKWISDERRQSFTARDCLEKIKGRWPKMSLVNPGLAILEERGFIFPAERERQGRGRPSKVYHVNPLVYEQMP